MVSQWKVRLTRNTEELSDDEQEDVVDPAAVDVYCLGGSDTSDAQVEVGVDCAGCAGRVPDSTVPMPVLEVLKTMMCALVYIGACIGLY